MQFETSDPPGVSEQGRSAVDFDSATLIEGAGGSTCQVYWQIVAGKKLFIKRLLPRYSYSSHHIAAYRKEFEAGRGFTDHRLPHYEAIAHDGTWVAMDYFEGVTLARHYAEHPRWWAKRRNVEHVLRELVEVVGYLHKYTFEHGDIKADNVMISEDGKNIKLIDLDKCFSDALCTTKTSSKKPSDFVALGRLADAIGRGRFDRFVRMCSKADVTTEELLVSLRSRRRFWFWTMLSLLAALAMSSIMHSIYTHQLNFVDNSAPKSVASEVVVPTPPIETEPEPESVPEIAEAKADKPEPEPVKMDYKSVISREVGEYFTALPPLLDEVEAMLDSGEADMAQMRNAQNKMIEVMTSCRGRAYTGFGLRYPGENTIDVQMAVADASNKLPEMVRFQSVFTRLSNRMIESGEQSETAKP